MAAISTILTSLIALGGIGAQVAGASQQADAAKKAAEESRKAEAIKQRQMELESQRRKRELIRQSLIARSQAVSQATGQGAQFGSSLPGALGAISSQADYNVQGANQSEALGHQLFQTNARIADAQGEMATGAGLSSLGGSLVKNLGAIGRLTAGI